MHLGSRPGHFSTRGQLLGYASAWFTMDIAPKLTRRVAAVCGAQGRVNMFACGREKKKKKKKKKKRKYVLLWEREEEEEEEEKEEQEEVEEEKAGSGISGFMAFGPYLDWGISCRGQT